VEEDAEEEEEEEEEQEEEEEVVVEEDEAEEGEGKEETEENEEQDDDDEEEEEEEEAEEAEEEEENNEEEEAAAALSEAQEVLAHADGSRLVVRLSAALAELLGQDEAAEVSEDELAGLFSGAGLLLLRGGLDRLRAKGLITYPSPLLGRLREELRDVLAAEVLSRLDSMDLAVLAQVGPLWLEAVVDSGLPRALKLNEFVGCVELLAWAKEYGCPWVARTCTVIARHGNLQVLRRARELDCTWDALTCSAAAEGGHLEVLVWAREHGCLWGLDHDPNDDPYHEEAFDCGVLAARGGHLNVLTWLEEHEWCPFHAEAFAAAAGGGKLEVLRWLRENGTEWYVHHDQPSWDPCGLAAAGGHLEVLKLLRDEGCEWSTETCEQAAMFGHLELLRWLRQNGCPWDEDNVTDSATR